MSLFASYFDQIVVINLPERSDRRRDMRRELYRHGLEDKTQFFSAVRPLDTAGFPGIGVRGCFLSHLEVLRNAQRAGVRNVVILEDDLTIAENFDQVQKSLMKQLESEQWDIAYFGHRLSLEAGKMPCFVPYHDPIVTAHFVAFNGSVLDRLVAYLEQVLERPPGHPLGGPMHVDGAYTMFRQQNQDVKTLVASPSLGWQRSSTSDITPNGWLQKNRFTRPIINALFAVKNRLANGTPPAS